MTQRWPPRAWRRADDTTGSVTICSRGRSGLFADDLGLIVRKIPARESRFAWADISHFADGCQSVEGGDQWVLQVVLRSGRVHRVQCTGGRAREVLPAVQQVAERYGIPADLTGVKMKDGLPASKGLFEDTGGKAGVRYWDGMRWSPLLAPSLRERWFVGVMESAALWADLPMAHEPWDYPAIRIARAKAWIGVCEVAMAALLAGGLAVGLEQRSWDALWAFFLLAANVLWFLIPVSLTWRYWRLIKQADEPFGATN